MAVYTQIDNPELFFQCKIYTGNGGSQSITFDGSENMQADMVWIKERDAAHSSSVIDSVRGVRKTLTSDEVASEITESNGLSAFDSDGLTFDGAGGNHVNDSSQATVAWCWKESATAGFGIETWTGDGNTNRDVAHNMSATPNVAIIKRRDSANSWIVYHHANTSAPLTDYLYLDTTDATSDASGAWIGVDGTNVELVQVFSATNTNTATYVGYFFAEKQGFSKFGSYEGNNNANGSFVYTGFSVAWVCVKNIDTGSTKWVIQDTKRSSSSGGNPADKRLKPNDATAEETDSAIDLLSNGFKIRSTGSYTSDADTFIYMAFAEAPFVNSKGVPCNAR